MNIERGIIGRDLGGKNGLKCPNTVLNRATPQWSFLFFCHHIPAREKNNPFYEEKEIIA